MARWRPERSVAKMQGAETRAFVSAGKMSRRASSALRTEARRGWRTGGHVYSRLHASTNI
jgi:hypothetical protein